MLKAGALFYTITIALLIAIVSSFLILFSYYNKLEFYSSLEQEQTALNAMSGITLLLSNQSPAKANDKQTIALFDAGNDSITLEKKSWGVYEIAISKAFTNHSAEKLIAQTGTFLKMEERFALYLADEDRPLSLSGSTLIKGKCYLPKAGIKRAYIEGSSFAGDKLVAGEVKTSTASIPAMNKDLLASLKTILNKNFSATDSILNIGNNPQTEPLKNSFENKTVYLYSKNSITLRNGCSGNIIIISDKSIFVSREADLHDVLLFAPNIEIEDNFNGNIQAFASDTLIVQENTKLNYPSVIGVLKINKTTSSPLLLVKENAVISGAVFSYQDNEGMQKQARISIEKDVKITGEIYTNGLLDLKGIVYGSVMCSKFMLSTPSSVYENHLLHATIDQSKLSQYYVGSIIMEETPLLPKEKRTKKIVKWLF